MNLRSWAIDTKFHGWRMVGFCAFSQFVAMGFSIYILGIYLQPMATDFGVSTGQLGMGMGFFYLVNSLVGPLVGDWVDRGRARRVMTLGALVFASGFILMALAPTLLVAALVCVLFLAPGACMLGVLPCATLLVQWFHRRQSFAIGVAAIGISVGGFVMPVVANTLIESLGWRQSLIILGAFILLVLMPLAWLFVVGRPSAVNQFPDGDSPLDPERPAVVSPQLPTRSILGRKSFWLLTFAVGFLSLTSIMMVTFVVPFALAKGLDSQTSALLISLYAGFAVAGKLLFGWLGDLISKRKAMILVQALATFGWPVMLFFDGAVPLMITVSMVGLSIGGLTPLWAALIAFHFGPEAFGRVKGIMTLAMLGFLILPGPLGGYLYTLYGSYAAGFTLIWWALPLGLFSTLLLPEHPTPVVNLIKE